MMRRHLRANVPPDAGLRSAIGRERVGRDQNAPPRTARSVEAIRRGRGCVNISRNHLRHYHAPLYSALTRQAREVSRLMDNQLTVRLDALSAQGVPLESRVSPNKTRRPALSRNAIYVGVEDVVAVGDDGEVLISGFGVGRASGTGGALESHIVVMDFIVAR